jgi:hypothetical protein
LRLPIEGTDDMVFLPAAGLPWFVAPFGRDSLIVALQNLLVYPDFAKGALEILGRCKCGNWTTTVMPSPARSCTKSVMANWRISG